MRMRWHRGVDTTAESRQVRTNPTIDSIGERLASILAHDAVASKRRH
jgi:hypothetical protein